MEDASPSLAQRRAPLLLAVVAALGLGCGGEGPQARFMAEADEICAASQAGARSDEPAPATLTGARRNAARLRERAADQLAALERLTPPRGDEEQVDRWRDQLRDNVEALGRLEKALRGGRIAAIRAAESDYRGGELRARELARAYGLNRCAQG